MSTRWLRRSLRRRVALPFRRRFAPIAEVRVGRHRLCVDVRDRVIGRTVYLNGEWEPHVLSLIAAMDLCGGVCVDVGANIGIHTIMLSDRVGAVGRVFAFEPEPHNFALLQRNLSLNGARNVTAVRAAVGDRCGPCWLALNPRNFGDHRVITTTSQKRATAPAAMTPLDDALGDVPAGAIRYVKIDVQGFECHVLRGMPRLIERNPRLILTLEVFPGALADVGSSPRALMQQLSDAGFSAWEFDRYRVLPVPLPQSYDLMRGGSVDVIASLDASLLADVLTRWFGTPIAPASQR